MIIKNIFLAVYGVAFIMAAFIGLEYHTGLLLTVLAFILAILTRFTLHITIGAFLGALNVWHWHWFFAAFFAFPSLVLVFTSVSILALITSCMTLFITVYCVIMNKFFGTSKQPHTYKWYRGTYKTSSTHASSQKHDIQSQNTVDSDYVITNYYASGTIKSKEFYEKGQKTHTQYYKEDGTPR